MMATAALAAAPASSGPRLAAGIGVARFGGLEGEMQGSVVFGAQLTATDHRDHSFLAFADGFHSEGNGVALAGLGWRMLQRPTGAVCPYFDVGAGFVGGAGGFLFLAFAAGLGAHLVPDFPIACWVEALGYGVFVGSLGILRAGLSVPGGRRRADAAPAL
jgi:hypothetical protein